MCFFVNNGTEIQTICKLVLVMEVKRKGLKKVMFLSQTIKCLLVGVFYVAAVVTNLETHSQRSGDVPTSEMSKIPQI